MRTLFGLRKTMLMLGLLAGLVFAGSIGAAPKQNPQKQVKHPHAEAAVKKLHEIKLLLESADHDYKGHRVAAIRHLNTAIRELGGHAKGAGGGGNIVPQKLSDDQLKAAVVDLAAMEKILAGASTHPRAAAAAVAVAGAIKELETALMIR
jgi:hypothetical protein